jgi:hypothetical protein
MNIKEAREILWEDTNNLSDEDIEAIIAMYRAVSRLFLQKLVKGKSL